MNCSSILEEQKSLAYVMDLSCLKSLFSVLGVLVSVEKIEELIKLLNQQRREATHLGPPKYPCLSNKCCACVSPSKQLLDLLLSTWRLSQPSARACRDV